MTDKTKEVLDTMWGSIQENANWIEGLGKMMSKVAQGMDDLTRRMDRLERKEKWKRREVEDKVRKTKRIT